MLTQCEIITAGMPSILEMKINEWLKLHTSLRVIGVSIASESSRLLACITYEGIS